MTNLNTTVGMNRFCGPAVLSILTGKSTDECAIAINRVTGKYGEVRGVYLSDLLRAAQRLGFDNVAVDPAATLFGTLTRLVVRGDGMYIVSLTDHFVCIEVNERKIYFCDNHTKQAIPAASSARLLQKVTNVNQVFKRPETVIPPPTPKKEDEPTPEIRSVSEEFMLVSNLYNAANLHTEHCSESCNVSLFQMRLAAEKIWKVREIVGCSPKEKNEIDAMFKTWPN